MHAHRDVFRGLVVVWAVGLSSFGCADRPLRQAPLRASTPPKRLGSRPLGDNKPVPPQTPQNTPTGQPPKAGGTAPAAEASPPPAERPAPPAVTPVSGSGPELPLSAPSDPVNQLRQLHRLAAERYAAMDSYIVRLRRRECVNGKDKPEEVILFKFRKQPWSVHFKWLGPEGAGREVVFVKGQYDNKMHTLLAAGDMPFAPAGKRIALAPDSVLVRNASRHAITEAGIGALLDRLGQVLEQIEKGDRQQNVTFVSQLKRPEYPIPLDGAELAIPPGFEPALPRGGRRLVLFDPTNRLPVLVVTHDERNHEVEYYCYDRFQCPVKLDDDDFNPDKLWAKNRKPQ